MATATITFSAALDDLKAGKKLARTSWAAGTFIAMYAPVLAADPFTPASPRHASYIAQRTPQDTVEPWVPSHADILATDWQVVA